jgi:hypothetical protein
MPPSGLPTTMAELDQVAIRLPLKRHLCLPAQAVAGTGLSNRSLWQVFDCKGYRI